MRKHTSWTTQAVRTICIHKYQTKIKLKDSKSLAFEFSLMLFIVVIDREAWEVEGKACSRGPQAEIGKD